MDGFLWFVIAAVIVLAIMVIVKAISNGADAAAEHHKDKVDRDNGAFEVSKPVNLADRYKPPVDSSSAPQKPELPQTPAASQVLTEPVICPGCGREMDPDEAFCAVCGTPRPS